MTDFTTKQVLGEESVGIVNLVEYKNSNELFTMKVLKKNVLLQYEQVENALLEKKILQTLEHPFLLSLNFCFQTEDKLYFVMPFIK